MVEVPRSLEGPLETPSTSMEMPRNIDNVQPNTPEERSRVKTPTDSVATKPAVDHKALICRTDSEDEDPEPTKTWIQKLIPQSLMRLLKPTKRRRKRKRRACRDQLYGPSTSHHHCQIHLPYRKRFFLPTYTYTSSDSTSSSDEDNQKPKKKKPRKF
ncbi:uncharacterized protein [Halyomorpha halys]|uniref:uncharacterized protein n=1 Tax=Halyomorpha halys TaxID=286706 RepID=UPI0006D51C36